MTDDTTQGDLTRRDVEQMPDSDLRSVLLAAFATIDAAGGHGFDELAPLPLQILDLPSTRGYLSVVPMVIEGTDGRPPGVTLEMVSSVIEGDPEMRRAFVIPVADPTLRAAAIYYRGWVSPDNAPDHQDRDPGDILGATPARFITGITVDNVGFTLHRKDGGDTTGRLTPFLDSEFLDSENNMEGDGPIPHTAAGRERHLLRQLHRTARALGLAYAEGVSAHDHPDLAVDGAHLHHAHPPGIHGIQELRDAAMDLLSQDASGYGPFAVIRGDHEELSRDDVERLPDTPLRTFALGMLDIEDHYETSAGWGRDPYITYRHSVSATGEPVLVAAFLDSGAPLALQLAQLAAAAEHDVDVRAEMTLSEDRYTGVSALSEGAWFRPTAEEWQELSAPGSQAPPPEEMVQGRLLIGVARDGGIVAIRRTRGEDPQTILVADLDQAARSFGGGVAAALRRLNAVYSAFDSTSLVVPEPNAEISDLPDDSLTQGAAFATIPYLWKRSEPREGRIYPPLPSSHPLADYWCGCGAQLADGLPVQAYVFDGDDGTDDWKSCEAVLVHQRCTPFAAALFANLTSKNAENAHDDDA